MSMFEFQKDTVKNVYLFYGNETYKKRLYRENLKKALTDGNDMNFSYFEGDSINLAAVYDSVVTLPFFADRRLVIVENCGKFKAKGSGKGKAAEEEKEGEAAAEAADAKSQDALILKILEDLPPTTCLAFFEENAAKTKKIYKLIEKKGETVACDADQDRDVITWLEKGFLQAGKRVNRNVLQLLVDRVGTDYDKLRTEYEKILGFVGDAPEVTAGDIRAIVSEDVEAKIFDMLGAMGRKNVKKVLEKYHDLLVNRTAPLFILAMLRSQFRLLLQTAEIRNKGFSTQETARILGKRDFMIRNAEEYLRGGFKMKDVRDILEAITETDEKIKQGELNDQTGVELLLVKYSVR